MKRVETTPVTNWKQTYKFHFAWHITANESWLLLISGDSCFYKRNYMPAMWKEKTKINIETSKCAIYKQEFANKQPPQTTHVHKGVLCTQIVWTGCWAVRQGMLLKQQLGRETIWGSGCWPPTPTHKHTHTHTLEPHSYHLLGEESLMGFRGKYQTNASDSQMSKHFMPATLFPGTNVVHYATVLTVTQEVKVCCA